VKVAWRNFWLLDKGVFSGKVTVIIVCIHFRSSNPPNTEAGGTRPGAQALRAHQHTFFGHLKRVLNRNLNQRMLKNAYLKKKLPLDPRVVPPTITPLSSLFLVLKCVLLSSKKDKITTVNVLLLLLPKLCSFCWRGAQKIFLAPGRRAPYLCHCTEATWITFIGNLFHASANYGKIRRLDFLLIP